MLTTILGTLFTWTASDTADVFSSANVLFNDFKPFIVPIISVLAVIVVIAVFVKALK